MRQVPVYGLIGRSKMAAHFAHYLQHLQIPFLHVPSRQAGRFYCPPALMACERLCILIKDSEIPAYLDAFPELAHKICIHFSGALVHETCFSAHPLMTFGDTLYPIERYQTFAFILTDSPHPFSQLLPHLPNPHYVIPAEMKPFYHAMCVMGGNFSMLLWQTLLNALETLNIPNEAVLPYIEQCFLNIQQNPKCQVTGPIQRQDHLTIQKNLTALDNHPAKPLYEAFLSVFNPEDKCIKP